MKRLFYAASFLLCLSVLFSACERSGTEDGTGKNEEYPIVGIWAIVEADNRVIEYFEFTKTGVSIEYCIDYKHGYGSYKDGVLSYFGSWEKLDVGKYWFEGGIFYWLYEEVVDDYDFEMINKDMFRISWENTSGTMNHTTFARIKKFSE